MSLTPETPQPVPTPTAATTQTQPATTIPSVASATAEGGAQTPTAITAQPIPAVEKVGS